MEVTFKTLPYVYTSTGISFPATAVSNQEPENLAFPCILKIKPTLFFLNKPTLK